MKAFALDDSLCVGLPHYPGDLLRPNGPSTHKIDALAHAASNETATRQTWAERPRKALSAPR